MKVSTSAPHLVYKLFTLLFIIDLIMDSDLLVIVPQISICFELFIAFEYDVFILRCGCGKIAASVFFSIYRLDLIEIELTCFEFDHQQIRFRFYNHLDSMRSEFNSLMETNSNLDFQIHFGTSKCRLSRRVFKIYFNQGCFSFFNVG